MGLGRVLAPRFQPCLFIRWRYGAERRAGLLFLALALAVAVELRVRIAAGRSHQEGLALRKSRVHEFYHAKGPALITFVNYARARQAEQSPPPADFLFANPAGGAAGVFGGGAERSELRGRRRRRRLAPASDGPR